MVTRHQTTPIDQPKNQHITWIIHEHAWTWIIHEHACKCSGRVISRVCLLILATIAFTNLYTVSPTTIAFCQLVYFLPPLHSAILYTVSPATIAFILTEAMLCGYLLVMLQCLFTCYFYYFISHWLLFYRSILACWLPLGVMILPVCMSPISCLRWMRHSPTPRSSFKSVSVASLGCVYYMYISLYTIIHYSLLPLYSTLVNFLCILTLVYYICISVTCIKPCSCFIGFLLHALQRKTKQLVSVSTSQSIFCSQCQHATLSAVQATDSIRTCYSQWQDKL